MKILIVVGARPQFIKLAPLVRQLPGRFPTVVVHTGQHYDDGMSGRFFRELELPEPDYHLGVGSGPHGAMTGRMLERIEETLLAEGPDLVLVLGDTNSTLAGALAAAKLKIPVAHVEAGLRSFNRDMPEEINRVLADHLSEILFAPTPTAVANLEREGITRGVHLVGDIMLDASREALERAPEQEVPAGDYLVLTLHRAENTDVPERLAGVLEALRDSPIPVLFPCHPRTLKVLEERGWKDDLGAVRLMEPVGHAQMLCLVRGARAVLTDSGGLQKEAYFLATPCLTLRQETEWVESVEAGWNRLVGTDPGRIRQALQELSVPARHPPLYGDGQTARRIVEVLEGWRR
jgi:UDP-N-acetylglucosamine 2-epimerase